MARMSREFPLVLLGAGVLTAGYFLYPERDVAAEQNKLLDNEVAANGGAGGRGYSHSGFIWIHSGYGGSARSFSAASTAARGGFGSMGRGAFGGGS